MGTIAAIVFSAALFGEMTYTGDVKPILDNHCTECHHTGGKDPDLSAFPFTSASMHNDQNTIVSKILSLTQPSDGKPPKMPPGSRVKLTEGEVSVISAWLDQGLQP